MVLLTVMFIFWSADQYGQGSVLTCSKPSTVRELWRGECVQMFCTCVSRRRTLSAFFKLFNQLAIFSPFRLEPTLHTFHVANLSGLMFNPSDQVLDVQQRF